jgi:hypothetical protein
MGSSLAMPHPWPNNPVELTAHSAGFLVIPGLGSCGPQLTGGVSHKFRMRYAIAKILEMNHNYCRIS